MDGESLMYVVQGMEQVQEQLEFLCGLRFLDTLIFITVGLSAMAYYILKKFF